MGFEDELKERVAEADEAVRAYMPSEATFQKTVTDAMEYTMYAGGKRIRPVLMKAVFDMFGGNAALIRPFMAALEMIHTYSLIHDDLPALDNDDYRRGRKTAHIVYGEAMAILAGDSLLNYAYETAAKSFSLIERAAAEDTPGLLQELMARRRLERAMEVLACKPGIYGMIGGQVADVELTGTRLSLEQLTYIYRNKTSALIEAAMMIGGILAGVEDTGIEKLEKAGYNIGMAFQIQDDILDETATFEELGKPIHSDEKNEKVTHVTLFGIEQSAKEAERLSEEAVSIVEEFGRDSEFLKELIIWLIHRKK